MTLKFFIMTKKSANSFQILDDETQRIEGEEALKINLFAARAVSETIKSTLGPSGMDKMLVDDSGNVVVTNSGSIILKELEIENPASKMMVEIAKTQRENVGDGTTTAVLIAGELLKNAEEFLDLNVHPSVIAEGYRIASKKAQKELNALSTSISIQNEGALKKVAETAMSGRGFEDSGQYLGSIIVEAVKFVAEERDNGCLINLDDIKILRKNGGAIEDTELIAGIAIAKEKTNPSMPEVNKNCKILVLKSPLDLKKAERNFKVEIKKAEELKDLLLDEEERLKGIVERIIALRASVVVCQRAINKQISYHLAKKGISAIEKVEEDDIKKISKATGASLVTDITKANVKDLGSVGLAKEIELGGDKLFLLAECKNPKSVTIIIRGGSKQITRALEDTIKDGLAAVSAAVKCEKVLPGGGSPEIEACKSITRLAVSVKGKKQLAVGAFADALEIIPKSLAENAGVDPIDVFCLS